MFVPPPAAAIGASRAARFVYRKCRIFKREIGGERSGEEVQAFRIERGDASIVVPEASDAELRHREVLGAIAELRALLSKDVLKVGQRRLGLS